MKKKVSFIKFFSLIFFLFINIFFSKPVFCLDEKNTISNVSNENFNLPPVVDKVLPSVVKVMSDFNDFYHGYFYDSSYKKQVNALSSLHARFSLYNSFIYKNSTFKNAKSTIMQNVRNSKLGSGIIIDSEKCYVITNYHVISDSYKIKVSLTNGEKYKAHVIGKNKKMDLALLKLVDAKDLKSVKISNSNNLNIGESVFAVGSPYNLKNTVTLGIISSLGRLINTNNLFDNFIQTDASINHGNSGGPLFNFDGELIGINTSMISNSEDSGSIGLGFSIPSNTVQRFINDTLKYGKVNVGSLGVSISTLSEDLIKKLELPLKVNAVLVNSVRENSSAEKSGIEAGDIIISINSKNVLNAFSLRRELINFSPNDDILLKIFRNNKYYDISSRLQKYHQKIYYAGTLHYMLQGSIVSKYDQKKLLKDIEDKKIPKIFLPDVEGIIINGFLEKSYAKRSGLQKNDIIISVNTKYIKNIKTFKEALSIHKNIIILEIMRQNKLIFKIIS
ncbi:Periplasmic serine endoprotease DegP [Buchnera aphidicola (Periphyllus testudinaceus)]|uniref:trypsin-like peptidase domain-containing protein n=1 Tax=Buchnera aphidicola TaxID=9 RepID=UPI003463EE3E